MRRALPILLASCATLADNTGGTENLPNARAGPFRAITGDELGEGRSAPYALRDDEIFLRDPSVVDADGEPASLAAWVYAAASPEPAEGDEPDPRAPASRIMRFEAADGRSPTRFGEEVLAAKRSPHWEGGIAGAPSVLRTGGEIRMYYEGAGGIGLAVGDDGLGFTRTGEPVLPPAADGWDAGAVPKSPSVVATGDGFQLFYAVEIDGVWHIGEARSTDGRIWERRPEPVIEPRAGGLDQAGAEAPHSVIATSAEGRAVQYLYYGADDGEGRTIAMAARYGTDGPFSRADAPVFGDDLGPTEPWVVRYTDFSLLFVTQRAGDTDALDFPAVAVGVAPATSTLP